MILDEVKAAFSAGKMLLIGFGIAVVFGLGFGVSQWWERSTINGLIADKASLTAQLSAANGNYNVCLAKLKDQDASVAALQATDDQRYQEVQKALADAQQKAVSYQQSANALLSQRPPAGADLCKSASALIDTQIKNERGTQ